jgi:hypothetical protein
MVSIPGKEGRLGTARVGPSANHEKSLDRCCSIPATLFCSSFNNPRGNSFHKGGLRIRAVNYAARAEIPCGLSTPAGVGWQYSKAPCGIPGSRIKCFCWKSGGYQGARKIGPKIPFPAIRQHRRDACADNETARTHSILEAAFPSNAHTLVVGVILVAGSYVLVRRDSVSLRLAADPCFVCCRFERRANRATSGKSTSMQQHEKSQEVGPACVPCD